MSSSSRPPPPADSEGARAREATPSAPGDAPKPTLGTGDPRADAPNPPGAAENTPGADPSKAKQARVRAPDGNDRWGDLPIQAREVFRNESSADLPMQYRDWIDAYYTRLLRVR